MNRSFWMMAITFTLVFSAFGSEIYAKDNPELIRLVEADQLDRMTDSDEPIAPKDNKRRKRVFQLLAAGEVNTPRDKYRAALILQHTGLVFIGEEMKSISAENYYLAHELAKFVFNDGNEDARRSVAVNNERYSWLTFGYQKYGTQLVWIDDKDYWVKIDSTTTDAERAQFGIRPLAELLADKPMEP